VGARRGRAFWEKLVAEVEGGERIVDVARRRGLNTGTLSWWCWKLRSESRRPPRAGARLLPIVVRHAPETSRSDATIDVAVGGAILRVPMGTDVEYVATLVAALRAC
jgi:transposase-like protein